MIGHKLKNCFHCATAGGASGAAAFAYIGNIMVSGIGDAFNVSLVPFMVIGIGIVLAAYGFIEVGHWMASREYLFPDEDDDKVSILRRSPSTQIS